MTYELDDADAESLYTYQLPLSFLTLAYVDMLFKVTVEEAAALALGEGA